MVLLVEDSHDEKRPILNSSNEFSQINLNTGAKSIDLQSKEAHHIIDLLVTAITQNDTSMITNCTEVLTRKINKDNALDCLGRLKLISTITHDFEPSAPPPGILGKKDSGESQNKDWISDLEDNLRNLCLLEIDKNADYILKKRDLLGLDYGDLFNITTRDTLQVSSELVVYSAVMRWAVAQQRRKEAKGEELNLRNTLQELIYAPRYGLMSKNEFLIRTIDDIQGPDRSGILKESEIQDILSYIKKKSKNQTVQPLPYKGSQPRKRRNSSENTSLNPVCEKHLLNFLTCWTAVFD